jgi:hypothetical protein
VLRALCHIGGSVKAVFIMARAARGRPRRSTVILPAVISEQDAETSKIIAMERATAPSDPSPTPLRSVTCHDITVDSIEKLKAKGFDWSDVF